jgi:threonine dehydratase
MPRFLKPKIAPDPNLDGSCRMRQADIDISEIQDAAAAMAGTVLRTPLIPLVNGPSDRRIWLKPENLQPRGSFKIRCSFNAVRSIPAARLAGGVATASAGNFGQGLTMFARERGSDVLVYVPDNAARTKLDALRNLGAELKVVTPEAWWDIVNDVPPASDHVFVHPSAERTVLVGNGTIGLEILGDLPDVDAILLPFGGGGLSCGVAAAAKAIKPEIRIVACECATAAPLAASFEAGRPATVERGRSFVDGIGATSVLSRSWPLLRALIDDVIVVSEAEAACAVRMLANDHRLIVEGAGGVALAAALTKGFAGRTVVPVLSGGNIDPDVLARILN